jgi:ABC-type glutathione transport system ATPase component
VATTRKTNISNEEQSHLVGMDDRNVEPVTSDLYSKARVQLRALRRVFNEGNACAKAKRSTVAVKGLSLAMYEGQITALLGHNGAGI